MNEIMTQEICPKARVVGLNSGTSVNSLDVVLVEFCEPNPDVTTFKILAYQDYPFEAQLRQQVFDACASRCTIAEICELNFWLGELFGRATQSFLAKAGLETNAIDLVASHGQTIYHQMAMGKRQSTLQLGEAAVIADLSGVSVASNFRVADVVAGGQGAPLVSFFDYMFFRDEQQMRAVLNIGGIANITYLPSAQQGGVAYAFDTGPGNMLIDYAASHYSKGALTYDKDGAMAQAGQINAELLAELMTTHFLQVKPPKSTGREEFGDGFGRELIWACEQRGMLPEDVVATLTAFTVHSIAKAHRNFGPPGGIKELIVSGGGVNNPVLMAGLDEMMVGVQVRSHGEFGVAAECKEAVTFALLGYELLRGRAATLPGCTGAKESRVLGQITPGHNYAALLQKFGAFMQNETNRDKGDKKGKWQPKRRLILNR